MAPTPFFLTLCALIIEARLGLTNEELIEQIKENPYLQLFIGLEGLQIAALFDPSMMVYFRKRLAEMVLNDCNERIVRHGLNLIRASQAEDHVSILSLRNLDEVFSDGVAREDAELLMDSMVKTVRESLDHEL